MLKNSFNWKITSSLILIFGCWISNIQSANSHFKCEFRTPWGSREEACPHGHYEPPPSPSPDPRPEPVSQGSDNQGLIVCNESSRQSIYIAYAKETTRFSPQGIGSYRISTHGWYRVQKNRCTRIYTGPAGRITAVLAQSGSRRSPRSSSSSSSNQKYCVDIDERFTFSEPQSDTQSSCISSGGSYINFRKISPNRPLYTFTFRNL